MKIEINLFKRFHQTFLLAAVLLAVIPMAAQARTPLARRQL